MIFVNMTMLVMESLMSRLRGRPRVNLEFRKLVSGITKRDFCELGQELDNQKLGPKEVKWPAMTWSKPTLNGHVIIT